MSVKFCSFPQNIVFIFSETLFKAVPAPNLCCEAAKPLQIRAHQSAFS
jgi:hypothetical protein